MINLHYRRTEPLLLSFFTMTGISSVMFRSRPFAPPLLYMRKDGFNKNIYWINGGKTVSISNKLLIIKSRIL
jgi:hypothetical protein